MLMELETNIYRTGSTNEALNVNNLNFLFYIIVINS